MTTRETFAISILQSIIRNNSFYCQIDESTIAQAVDAADLLIKTLKKDA